MSPFWPIEEAESVVDSPRKDWDEWGPQMQEEMLRRKIGNKLFDWLEEAVNDVPDN
jgi:hypothetical protein